MLRMIRFLNNRAEVQVSVVFGYLHFFCSHLYTNKKIAVFIAFCEVI